MNLFFSDLSIDSSIKINHLVGISKLLSSKTSLDGNLLNQIYTAPEGAAPEGSTNFKSDLWSVGVLTYIMLIGNNPFSGKT